MMFRTFLSASILFFLVGCSAVESTSSTVSQQELLQQIKAKADILILDVRTPAEFREGHIPGAYNIDHREIESRKGEVEAYRDKTVIVYCYSGVRAGKVESFLIEQGFTQVKHLQGDWSAWSGNKLPFE